MSWEEESQGTAGTVDMTDMRHGVSFSGIPDSDDGEEDDEDELFEAADNLDLGAVDLCVSVLVQRCTSSPFFFFLLEQSKS